MKYNFEEGELLLINKPYTWTSFDAVNKIRASLKIKKIGHAGTLDPLATGLLILCTGKKTKLLSTFQDLDKVYTGELILGKTTPSFDLETAFDSEQDFSSVTESQVLDAAEKLSGDLMQLPPVYSAVKVDGKRMYKKARKGEIVEVKARPVKVFSFKITKIELPSIFFEINCSKGTYIRSLASDFGKILNCGAYLNQLTRTRIGEFNVDNATDPVEFVKEIQEERRNESL